MRNCMTWINHQSIKIKFKKSKQFSKTIKLRKENFFTYATVRGSGKCRSQAIASCVTMTTRSAQERRIGPPGTGVTSQPRSIDPPEFAPLFKGKVQGCQKSEVGRTKIKVEKTLFSQSEIFNLYLQTGRFIFQEFPRGAARLFLNFISLWNDRWDIRILFTYTLSSRTLKIWKQWWWWCVNVRYRIKQGRYI